MGSLEYSLETNITNLKNDIFPVCLDRLIFQTADGNYLEVESQGFDEFDYTDGELVGRWKDNVVYRQLDATLNITGDGEFRSIDNDELFYALITALATNLVGFRVDEEGLCEHGFPEEFVPECKEADIRINFSNGDEFCCARFNADELLTESNLWLIIRENFGRGD